MSEAGKEFERLVFDFCVRKWGEKFVDANRLFGQKEVDIYVNDGDSIILIECTIERGKQKAIHDITKIRELRKILQYEHPHSGVSGLFITQHDPSPEVHQVAADNGSWIKALSFPAFVSKFFASQSYLLERSKHAFGSVRSPIDDTLNISRNVFVAVPFRNSDNQKITIDKIISDIGSGTRTRLVLTGDFGLGKSMTFREIFYRLSEKFSAGDIFRFPLYINLRDSTFDETDGAVDIIERHAKWVGLRDKRDQFVQAWKNDATILLLDGFDEVIRSGFTGLTTSSRDIRFASSHIIRELVSHSPPSTPIFICGRESYFATIGEMNECLGTNKFSHASLHDLQEKEVKELFHKLLPKQKNFFIFDWIPQRPLLLAYLYFSVSEGSPDEHGALSAATPGEGWEKLLLQLCARETKVAKGASPDQIKRLLERVALYGRTNIQEQGHVTSLHVAQAYRDIFRAEPDLSVQQVLMRLPGLTAGRADEVRRFIDTSFFEAAQAGTVAETVAALGSRATALRLSDEYKPLLDQMKRTATAISPLTAQVTLQILRKQGILGALYTAMIEASDHYYGNITADLLICHLNNTETPRDKNGGKIHVKQSHIPIIEISDENIGADRIHFSHSVIENLEIALSERNISKITFDSVRVGHLHCSVSTESIIKKQGLTNTETITHFDSTSNDILSSNIPDSIKSMKIILRKLFRQPGSGRMRSAFYRGTGDINKEIIDDCISILVRENIIYFTGLGKSEASVFYPNRFQTRRISTILDSPGLHNDPIITSIVEAWP